MEIDYDEQIKELEISISLNWKFRFKTSSESEYYYIGKTIEKEQKALDKLITERNLHLDTSLNLNNNYRRKQ